MLVSPDLLSEISQIPAQSAWHYVAERELEGDASVYGSLFGPKLAQATGQVGPFVAQHRRGSRSFWELGIREFFCHGKQHLKHVTIEMTSQIRSKTSLLLELPNKNMFRSAVLIKSSLSSCAKQPWLGVILPQTSSRKLEVYPIL